MPSFPRTSSQRSLTTQQPRAFRSDADYRNDAAANTKIATTAIQAIQDTAIKWDNAMTTSQLNAFKAQKGVFLADVKSRATLDPDQNAGEKYIKEIEDYSKNAFKGMSERAKREAALELQTDVQMAKIQVGGIFQKKIISQAKLGLTDSLEGYKQNILDQVPEASESAAGNSIFYNHLLPEGKPLPEQKQKGGGHCHNTKASRLDQDQNDHLAES